MKYSWLLIVTLLMVMSLKAWAQPVDTAVDKSSLPRVLILGDSISAGYGLEPGQGWVALLEQQLNVSSAPVRLINASISGETTSGGLSRLPQLLKQFKPQLLVIELGANDGLRGTPLPIIERNLQALVRQGQQAGAQVLLLGMRIPPNYGPRYSGGFFMLYKNVADASKSHYLPFLLQDVGGVDELMQADGLHPNAQAQPRLLDNVAPLLMPLLQQLEKSG